MKPLSRPRHDRVSSVSLQERRKAQSSKLKLLRIAALVGIAVFVIVAGAHLWRHPNHFQRQSVLAGHQEDVLWAGSEELDFHDLHLHADTSSKRSKGKRPVSHLAHAFASIQINNSLPSLVDLDPSVRDVWESALDNLENGAQRLLATEGLQTAQRRQDIPGTSITAHDEARSLQEYLDCNAGQGEYTFGSAGRVSLEAETGLKGYSDDTKPLSSLEQPLSSVSQKIMTQDLETRDWTWKPSDRCARLLRPWSRGEQSLSDLSLPSKHRLCRLLRHKHILLLGDSPTQYLIHDLLLDWTSDRPQTCYGDVYCKEHAICGGSLADIRDSDSSQTESAENRKRGTILRYRRLDSLFMNASPAHPRHQPLYIHPYTGIRDINMYAMPDARRSDVVILYKAPIPFPLGKTSISRRGKDTAQLVQALQEDGLTGAERASRLIRLVERVTSEIWLPEIMATIEILATSVRDKLLVYRSGWRMQARCSRPDHSSIALPHMHSLRELIFGDKHDLHSDIRAVFHNLQTIVQNHLVRTYLFPHVGMIFLDLDSPTSIWQSSAGVQSVVSSKVARFFDNAGILSTPKAGDCLRMALPSPGLALEEAFLGGLSRLLEWDSRRNGAP